MISVCPTCSGIDLEKLEEKFGADSIEVGCIGECGGRDGLIIGYAKGSYIEAETEKEFIKKIEE